MLLITEYAGKNDPSRIALIATTANRIRQLSDKLDEIEHEIPRLKETLAHYESQTNEPIASRTAATPAVAVQEKEQQKSGSKKKLRIEIDWSRMANTKSKKKEVISEHMSSDTLTLWVTRLFQELGEPVLTTLQNVRINRGPLISKEPQNDFKNKADGTLYSHQPILNTGYHVLTHSKTSQKFGDIKKACHALSLPTGMVVVTEVDKDEWINFLLD